MPIHFWPKNECLNRLVITIEGAFIRIPREGFHASCYFLSWNIRKCLGCLGCVVQLQKEEQGLTIALVWQLLICGSRWWMFVWKMTFFDFFSLCSVLVSVHNLWQEGMSFGLPRTEKSWGCRGKREINFSFVHLKFMSLSEIWAWKLFQEQAFPGTFLSTIVC